MHTDVRPRISGVFLSLPLPCERKKFLQKIKGVLDTFDRQKYQESNKGFAANKKKLEPQNKEFI
jgi:hypothetical protein